MKNPQSLGISSGKSNQRRQDHVGTKMSI